MIQPRGPIASGSKTWGSEVSMTLASCSALSWLVTALFSVLEAPA